MASVKVSIPFQHFNSFSVIYLIEIYAEIWVNGILYSATATDSKHRKVCKTILFTSQNGSKATTVYAHADRGHFIVVRWCGVRSRQRTAFLLCIEDKIDEILWSLLHTRGVLTVWCPQTDTSDIWHERVDFWCQFLYWHYIIRL